MDHGRRKRFAGPVPQRFLAAALLLYVLCSPGGAVSQTLNGSLQWSYNNTDTRVDDAVAGSSRSQTNAFSQQYQVYLNTYLTKMLGLRAGGTFQETDSDVESGGTSSHSSFTRINPMIGLSIGDPFFTLDANYAMKQDRSSPGVGASITNIQETWSASFSMRPTDLPTLNLSYVKSNIYDKDRLSRDDLNDFFGLTSRYTTAKNLDLQYLFSYNKQQDRLQNVETERTSNTGKVTYGANFFQNRLTFNADYQISYGTADTVASGNGTVTAPVTGLLSGYSQSNVPDPANVTLPPDPALVPGFARINVGQGARLPPQSITSWNIGLQIQLPNAPAQVNTLFVYLDNDVSPVATQFNWTVYVSKDNLQWTLHQPPVQGSFNTADNHFEISFPVVNLLNTPYVKVVVSPLPAVLIPPPPPGIDFATVFITKMIPFLRLPAAAVTGKTSATSQVGNLSARVLLMDIPNVYYDFNFSGTSSSPGGFYNYSMYNGLTATQQFSRVYSGTARIAVTNTKSPAASEVGYLYDGSLAAAFLKSLSSTLSFSGRVQQTDGQSTNSNSLFLNNYARLYEGIDFNLSGGVTRQTNEAEKKNSSANVAAGLNVVPRKSFSLGLYGSKNWSRQAGGGKPDTSSTSDSANASVSWQPSNTLYLAAAYNVFSQSGTPTSTTQNYSLNFSPFQGGTLRFNITYNQGRTTPGNEKFSTITPSVRWQIRPATSLDVSYQINQSETATQTASADIFAATLKTAF